MESVDREDITVACNTCQICHKSFSSKGSLKQHGDIHEELKKFPCLLCQKTLSQAGDLKRHKLVHTGEKPHQCTSLFDFKLLAPENVFLHTKHGDFFNPS